MSKKLILAGLVVSSFCLTQFSACSDDDDEDNPQQQVPTDSTKVSPSDSSKVSPTDSSMVSPADSTVQFTDTMTVSGKIENYSYVDLGLKSGLKWATYNVGATEVADYGDYFTWASTEANKLTDKYCSKPSNTLYSGYYLYEVYLNKYNSNSSYVSDIWGGNVDDKLVLDASDDAAAVNWGNSWRMPTKVEIDELIEGCTWTWVDNYGGTGISGQMGTSKANGNTIFLPAAGVYSWIGLSYHVYSETTSYESLGKSGYYWSSTRDESDSNKVYSCSFGYSSVGTTSNTRIQSSNYIRAYSVRAVSE